MSDTGPGGLPPTGRPLGEVGEEHEHRPAGAASRSDDFSAAVGSPTRSDHAAGTGSGGTADTAKAGAGQVAQDAKDSGRAVASTAVAQGKDVLHESRRQVKDLTSQARQQVSEQSRAQQHKAASGLRSLADELSTISSGTGGQSGVVTDLAGQAADRIQHLAGWLQQREPGELVEELRGMARRRPGVFLLGALAAGVAAGRLTRGAVDAARSEGGGTPDGTPATPTYQPTGSNVDLTMAGGLSTAGGTGPSSVTAPGQPTAEVDQPHYSDSTGGLR